MGEATPCTIKIVNTTRCQFCAVISTPLPMQDSVSAPQAWLTWKKSQPTGMLPRRELVHWEDGRTVNHEVHAASGCVAIDGYPFVCLQDVRVAENRCVIEYCGHTHCTIVQFKYVSAPVAQKTMTGLCDALNGGAPSQDTRRLDAPCQLLLSRILQKSYKDGYRSMVQPSLRLAGQTTFNLDFEGGPLRVRLMSACLHLLAMLGIVEATESAKISTLSQCSLELVRYVHARHICCSCVWSCMRCLHCDGLHQRKQYRA